MKGHALPLLTFLVLSGAVQTACQELPWPDSPLYVPPASASDWKIPTSVDQAKAALAGHYAHYDIVAYEAKVQTVVMRTFIISYGFTDFVLENRNLVEFDRFCHAEHRANQNVVTTFDDAATQAIKPRQVVVDVYQENQAWKIWRPATPTLLGIGGDPDEPLSMDTKDPKIKDDDGDGKPGVTVKLKINGSINAEIYIARREVFQNDLTYYQDGRLQGHVVDHSEQLVIGGSPAMLPACMNASGGP